MISDFSFKNSFILFCDASACWIIELIHPKEATGQVNMLTYIINSAIIPILSISPSKYCFPPTYMTKILLSPISKIIKGKNNACILTRLI